MRVRGAFAPLAIAAGLIASGSTAGAPPTSSAGWPRLTSPIGRIWCRRSGSGWWRGAWELWAEPRWSGGMLRMRVDPALHEVIDARTIPVTGAAPDDEPGAAHIPGGEPDVIVERGAT